jgi:hypothetical protein
MGVVAGATLVGALRSAGCFAGDDIVAGAVVVVVMVMVVVMVVVMVMVMVMVVVVVVGTVAGVTTGAVRRTGSFAGIRAACTADQLVN